MSARHNRDPEKEKYWRDQLALQKKSGLTQAAYCRREGVNENSFSSWKKIVADRDLEEKHEKAALKKIEKESQLPRTPPQNAMPSFVPLILAGAEQQPSKLQSAVIEIRLPGAAILVFSGADAETLRTVMLTCRECWY